MKRRLIYILVTVIAVAGIASGQESLVTDLAENIFAQNQKDTILTTVIYMENKNSVRNDSSIYLPWYNNVISVLGVYQQGDSINYFNNGTFDSALGVVYLGRKNSTYKNRPVAIVYKYRITPEQELKYFGGFSVDFGLAQFKKCIMQDIYGNDKNIAWPGYFIDLEFYAGRNNFYASLGMMFNSAQVSWLKDRDTIEIDGAYIVGDMVNNFSSHKLIFCQMPCLIHYVYPAAENLTYIPEAGITYSWLNSEICEYEYFTGREITNIDQNKHCIAAQIGLGVEFNTSVSLGRVLGGGAKLYLNGKYDYTTAFHGANIYEISLSSKMSTTIPLWRKRETKLFFRQYQSGWLSLQECGLMVTMFF